MDGGAGDSHASGTAGHEEVVLREEVGDGGGEEVEEEAGQNQRDRGGVGDSGATGTAGQEEEGEEACDSGVDLLNLFLSPT